MASKCSTVILLLLPISIPVVDILEEIQNGASIPFQIFVYKLLFVRWRSLGRIAEQMQLSLEFLTIPFSRLLQSTPININITESETARQFMPHGMVQKRKKDDFIMKPKREFYQASNYHFTGIIGVQ